MTGFLSAAWSEIALPRQRLYLTAAGSILLSLFIRGFCVSSGCSPSGLREFCRSLSCSNSASMAVSAGSLNQYSNE